MARSFRIYGKKRGHRRTGSHTLGRAGELAFFCALLAAGLVGLWLFVRFLVVPEWRANHEFREADCRVLDARVEEIEGEDGPAFRPEVQIEYEVDGGKNRVWTYSISGTTFSTREAAQKALEPFPVDKENPRVCRCWYDPRKPDVAILVRGYRWWVWLIGLVPAAFILAGSGGAIYAAVQWGKSAEARAVITRRVKEVEIFGGEPLVRREFPTVPDGADITNSPGTRLQYRLPMAASPGWPLAITSLVCFGWNGIVAVWAAYALMSVRSGQPDWVLIGTVAPFAAVGLGLLAWFVRQVIVAAGVGPTQVEISAHPLSPGGNYRLFVSQAGHFTLRRLEVALVCEEEATFRQGTNTRTETREVFRSRIFAGEGFEVKHAEPFAVESEFSVPAAAMHSFKSGHNAVVWKLVVSEEIAGWPNVKRCFTLIVQPRLASVESAVKSFC